MLKSPLAKQETQVQSLGGDDPMEEEKATHSIILFMGNTMKRGACGAIVPCCCKE